MKKTYLSIGEGIIDPKRHADICLQLRWTEAELERIQAEAEYWKNVATALAMQNAIEYRATYEQVINEYDNKTIHFIMEDYERYISEIDA